MVDNGSLKDQLMGIRSQVPPDSVDEKKGDTEDPRIHAAKEAESPKSIAKREKRRKAKKKKALERKKKKAMLDAMNEKTREIKEQIEREKTIRANIEKQAIEPEKQQRDKPVLVLSTPSNVNQNFSFQESNTSFFKDPDIWVSDGRELHSESGRILQVTIGIDFGTAYTKVVISTLGKVFVVDWGGVNKQGSAYWIPGEVSVRESDSAVLLGHAPTSSKFFGNLKVPFLGEQQPNLTQQARATIFLAWVMRYTRAWFYHEHNLSIQGRRIAWSVNLGTANSSWEDDKCNILYKKVGLTAWKMSQQESNFTIDKTKKDLQKVTPDIADIGLDLLEVVPEFLAQIAGYTRSQQRKDGLHLLVDVGAGTVDIAVFNVYHYNNKEKGIEEDRFVLIASSVEQVGAYFFMQHRLNQIGNQDENWSDSAGVPTKEEFSRSRSISIENVKKIDQVFSSHVGDQIKKVLQSAATYYQTAPEFNDVRCKDYRLKTFLAGGGSSCDIYGVAVDSAFASITANKLIVKIPVPNSLADEIAETEFHRLSVAFGLTFDKELIGRIYTKEMIGEERIQAPTQMRPNFGDNYLK